MHWTKQLDPSSLPIRSWCTDVEPGALTQAENRDTLRSMRNYAFQTLHADAGDRKESLHLVVELFGSDLNGRKMIAWGRRVGCRDAGHGFEPGGRGVYTRLLVDDGNPQQHSFLMELVDNPTGLRAINPAPDASLPS